MAPADGSTAAAFSMEAFAPRRSVDHRLSLRVYFRTADNLLKQANIYRRETNVIELYVLLLRYASLVSETIPVHRQYRGMNHLDKAHLRRKLVEAVRELESLKPEVELHIKNMNRHLAHHSAPSPLERLPSTRSHSFPAAVPSQEHQRQTSKDQLNSYVYKSTLQPNLEDQFDNLSLRLPTPKAETLARHSFLRLQPQKSRGPELPLRVQYPSLLDTATIESINQHPQSQVLESIGTGTEKLEEGSLLQEAQAQAEPPSQFDLVNQLSPPPVPVPVQTLQVVDPEPKLPLEIDAIHPKEPKHLHMSTKIMDEFMEMAKSNTLKNIETCGILAGSLEGGKFFVTALIIPKQEATANTCETINEEEIFITQDKLGLFQLGWIHTHPSQSCFMSSVDLHTHYSYQVMLQEAIAIVMAPQDPTRNHGIFRLSDPGGVNVIQQCPKRGFHAHDGTTNGGPIYEKCSHVYMDSKVRFEVIDLR